MQIDNGSFTPLVFSSLGGMGRECQIFYSRLAEKISEVRQSSKAEASTFIRTKLSFALVKATNLCLRGSRNWKHQEESNLGDTDITVVF